MSFPISESQCVLLCQSLSCRTDFDCVAPETASHPRGHTVGTATSEPIPSTATRRRSTRGVPTTLTKAQASCHASQPPASQHQLNPERRRVEARRCPGEFRVLPEFTAAFHERI